MTNSEVDAAYNVRATVSVATFEATIADYRRLSDVAVGSLPGHFGIPYDASSDELLDVVGVADGELRPVVIAIHGGYWRALSRHDTAFMAGPLDQAGIATVAVDYSLAPAATLEEIVRQVRTAVAWVYHQGASYGLDCQRIVVTGSSAGGQLAATTAVDGWQAHHDLPADVVKGIMAISGLFDLRPLVDSFANEWLGLDEKRAAALSPGLGTSVAGTPAIFAVAEFDGSGFLEQSRVQGQTWARHSPSRVMVVPGRNHYDVFLDLADPASELTRLLIDLVQSSDNRVPPGPGAAA